jgi:hypothetical protein
VLAVGKKSNRIDPALGEAPPLAVPNGSADVFATARPVSKGGNTAAYGISIVVFVGTMLTIVTGPTSACAKHGYPLPVVGTPRSSTVVSQTGAIVDVTVIDAGVVTAAVLLTVMAVTSISIVSAEAKDEPMISMVAVGVAEVTVVEVPPVVN